MGRQTAKYHLYFWVRDRLEIHQEKLGIHTLSISMAGTKTILILLIFSLKNKAISEH